MQEEWKPILDYPDYEVSNLGNARRNNKLLKPLNHKGYYRICLCNNGKEKRMRIHRLVACAFLPNPDNLLEVDHIDRNKANNIVTNLRWINHSDNCLNTHRQDKELFGISKTKNNKYYVRLTKNNKTLSFGTYDILEDAIKVRDENRLSLLGNQHL